MMAALIKRSLEQHEEIIESGVKAFIDVGNSLAAIKLEKLYPKEFDSFDRYVWQFVGGRPLVNRRRAMKEFPTRTTESDAMSKDLLKRGFKFVGTTICYAFMQASGMVNDHLVTCPRHAVCAKLK